MDWTDIHQSALETLIDLSTSAPVMAYPDFQKPFVLHTDVLKDELGAVLYQYQVEIVRIVAYGSRSLTPAEKNYHLHSGKVGIPGAQVGNLRSVSRLSLLRT